MTDAGREKRTLRIDSLAEYRDIAQALSLEPRARVIELLEHGPMNVSQIAAALDSPVSTVIRNIQKLEAAGLVRTELRTGRRGTQRVCALRYDRILIDFTSPVDDGETTVSSIPVGHFVAIEARGFCGLADATGLIGELDDPRVFQLPGARDAGLLWFTAGFVEYHLPNPVLADSEPTAVEFVAELCSEAAGFAADWPSGITLWINDIEIGTWIAPGDFGGRRGRFSPSSWPLARSQFGIRTAWRVTQQGASINGSLVSKVVIDDLRLRALPFVSVRIGVAEDSANPHGVNVFGRGFGDYDDDLMLFVEHASA